MKEQGNAPNTSTSRLAIHCRYPAWIWIVALILTAIPSVQAETLWVLVRDGRTAQPITGAFVMVGPWEGQPFAGNVLFTGPDGGVLFDDATLGQPQTVTAGAEGFGFTTLCEAALGEVVLSLYPVTPDSTMAGQCARVEGVVNNISVANNDGKFDVAIIMPSLPVSGYALQDALPFLAWNEMIPFPFIGDVEMPSNTYMPEQVEFLFIPFSKSPYWLDVPGNRTTTFFAVTARIPIEDLIAGEIINTVVREVGVERDVMVSGPMTLDIDSDLSLSQDLTVRLRQIPDGANLQAGSIALIMEDGIERAIGYDTRGDLELRGTTYLLSSRNPSDDLADAVNAAIGTYSDSSAAEEFSAGILDRSGFQLPYEVIFNSWMKIPDLEQIQRDYYWTDPTDPGISPSPTWCRSNLGLRASDPADSTYQATVHWRVYAPAEPRHFELPALPPSAPGPPGGLPDPEATPEDDLLYWMLIAANPPGEVQLVLDDFLQGGTHWSSRWIPVTLPESGIDSQKLPALQVMLQASPTPSDASIRFSWASSLVGEGVLELFGSDGRLVRRFGVPLSGSAISWDGCDQLGQPVAAGVYWAMLRQGTRSVGHRRVVWLRSSP